MYLVRKIALEMLVRTVLTVSCITSNRCQADFKFESLLYIIHTKFDRLDVFGEENSTRNVCAYFINSIVEKFTVHTYYE